MADQISTDAAAAKAARLSYGQYMAMKADQGAAASARQSASAAAPADDMLRQCPVCGDDFYPKRKTQVCCSTTCQARRTAELNRVQNVNQYRRKHNLAMTPRPCIHCGVMFVPPHASKRICSEECYRARATSRVKQRRAEAKEAVKDEKL